MELKKRKNWLLVIAINNYSDPHFPTLNNAVGDAKKLIQVLTEKYDFELFSDPLFDENATKNNIYHAFIEVISCIDKDDNLIIFFAGHGIMHPITNKGFWIPTEAKNRPIDFIPNSEIKDYIQTIPAAHVFLIIDSCFSGTFLTRTRSVSFERNYSALDARISRWVLASGGEETVSDGIQGKESPFFSFLYKFLDSNIYKYTSVQELIRYVTILTGHNFAQKPIGASIANIGHDGGEMIFTLKDEFVKLENKKSNGLPRTPELSKEIRDVQKQWQAVSAGKEIFLTEGFNDIPGLLVWECFRFDDEGNKKITFDGEKAKMNANGDETLELNLYARFATWEGFEHFWQENGKHFEGKKVVILGAAEEIKDVESTDFAIHQQSVLLDLWDENKAPMKCLHCGEAINSNNSLLVEIDEVGLLPAVGNVHLKCRRAADRILGKAKYVNPVGFNFANLDLQKWTELWKKGQAFLHSSIKTGKEKKQDIYSIAWNREHIFNDGEFCIKIVYKDKRSGYVMIGRNIHRFSREEIDSEVDFFNNSLIEPESDEKDIDFYEKAKYSKQLEVDQTDYDNDYTPLIILVDSETNGHLHFGNLVPMISDISQFEALYKNWSALDPLLSNYTAKIIENDKELDLYLISYFEDKMMPVINPVFDIQKKLVKGIIIRDFHQIVEEAERKNYKLNPEGKWKAGDKVKVIFPNHKGDRVPIGILVVDEFVDETGELCSIFRPIEDGVILEDLQYKMPVRLFQKYNT